MASLRSQLGRKLSYKTLYAEYEGQEYSFGGYPSSTLLIESTMPDQMAEQLAKMWNISFCPKDENGKNVSPAPVLFKPDDIGRIKCVHHYALPFEGEEPYTLTEFAEIFATNPALFANLYGAAMTVMTASNPLDVVLGNSSAGEPAT
jgi:hypothetical protein